jgi:hypothetical protein
MSVEEGETVSLELGRRVNRVLIEEVLLTRHGDELVVFPNEKLGMVRERLAYLEIDLDVI